MIESLRDVKQLLRWRLSGRPLPPPSIFKQRTVRQYQKTLGPRIFVETGTYLGDMVAAVAGCFKQVYSIELSRELYHHARARFAERPHVEILLGDSAEVLPRVLRTISEPCLFWLDGHYSGGITARGNVDYPLLEELDHIGHHPIKNHVILIDDSRLFQPPATPDIDQIFERLKKVNTKYSIEDLHDIIRSYLP